MRRFFTIPLLSAIALMPFPAAGQGAGTSPVAINACGPMLNGSNSTQTLFGLPLTSSSSGISIQFTNQSTKTANLINFAVHSNGDSFVIRDVGTFSPNIEITHRYRNGAGQAFVLPQFIAPKIACHVQSVTFTDGSVWRRGETAISSPAPSAGSNPLTSTPQTVALDRNAEEHLFMVTSNAKVAAFSQTDTCANIAAISLAASGEAAATYTVKAIAPGTCSALIKDEAGNNVMVGITIR